MKFLFMDVDGTLTDGKIYMGNDGEVLKTFNIKDGCGIKDILPQHRIVPVIITARGSDILKKRCDELGISYLYQGVRDKKEKLFEIIAEYNRINQSDFDLRDCAYIGDDILDLQCMKLIREEGGLVGCPSDAVAQIKSISNYVCNAKAGEGAVREFIEWLIAKKHNLEDINKRVNDAINYLRSIDVDSIEIGVKNIIDDNFYFMIQSYMTKPVNECQLESHRKNIDIQIMLKGVEFIDIADVSRLCIKKDYDEDKDIMFWNAPPQMARTTLNVGDCIVLYPENAHRGAVTLKENTHVLKIVGKVRV